MLNGVRAKLTTQEIVDGSDGGERVEKVESELRACRPFVCIFWWHGETQLLLVRGKTCGRGDAGIVNDWPGHGIIWTPDWGKCSLERHGLRCQIVFNTEFEAHAVFEMGWKNTIVNWMRVSTAIMAQMNFTGES
jgi:hypothetical protein